MISRAAIAYSELAYASLFSGGCANQASLQEHAGWLAPNTADVASIAVSEAWVNEHCLETRIWPARRTGATVDERVLCASSGSNLILIDQSVAWSESRQIVRKYGL